MQDAETYTSANFYHRGRRLKKLLRIITASQVSWQCHTAFPGDTMHGHQGIHSTSLIIHIHVFYKSGTIVHC